jgi:DNA polymerase III delta prime subunit
MKIKFLLDKYPKMNKNEKEKLTMKALEELLEKIETDIRRARLLIHQLATGDFSATSEDEFKQLAQKFATYNEGEEIKVIE